jgi:hypothetical protein
MKCYFLYVTYYRAFLAEILHSIYNFETPPGFLGCEMDESDERDERARASGTPRLVLLM